MTLPTVSVLMGGPDAEREVSINSGSAVASALETTGKFKVQRQVIDRVTVQELLSFDSDVIFPVLHGPYGEGGHLQELLEQADIPFVGSDSTASKLAMDKSESKRVAHQLGIQTPDWQLIRNPSSLNMAPPIAIKPNDDGSSIGIFLCESQDEIDIALQDSFETRSEALVERMITGRELTVGVVEGKPLPVVEITPAKDVGSYNYDAKYVRDDTQFVLNPPVQTGQCVEDALNIYTNFGLRDLARVDFMLNEDGCWFLEVNTMPGFTDHSLLPLAAQECGISMTTLCSKLVELAIQRGIKAPK